MPWRLLPWKAAIRRVAKAQGFLDPILLLARLGRFGKPAEARTPTELLRMGVQLHARGLINNQAIQHNLDWIWPYWVVRQFDPRSISFIPRAFSLTHINLTHRNWTAIGLPSSAEMPLVDPSGLVTPLFDGWSIDGWIVPDEGEPLLPSRGAELSQRATVEGNLAVITRAGARGMLLESRAAVEVRDDSLVCRVDYTAVSGSEAWLVIALRPYNPEGISFIRELSADRQESCFQVNRKHRVELRPAAERFRFSRYEEGDVFHSLFAGEEGDPSDGVECEVEMATGAALYRLSADQPFQATATVPLDVPSARRERRYFSADAEWDQATGQACRLRVADERINELYRLALRAVVLCSPHDIYPGPYTYKRFWFRDAAIILQSMLAANLIERAERSLERFFPRQTVSGYFSSQEGEWDANGQVLWALRRFCELSGRKPPERWWGAVRRAAEWIRRKRAGSRGDELHAGLLPAGFSAEHFGPNDYYFWDDFWAVAGLEGASLLAAWLGRDAEAAQYRLEAASLLEAVEGVLERVAGRLGAPLMPASPTRRMDSGAIGSLAAGYPLQLWEPGDRRLLATVEYLLDHCLVKGAFFHDMSHSGLNPYLTLHLAQVLLRRGDPRFFELVNAVSRLATLTGQWPEAVHPRTLGGCMGDGQHIWAAAEWLMMMRNMFVREEGQRLVLLSGIPERWLRRRGELFFGPAPTPFGKIVVRLGVGGERHTVSVEGEWYEREPDLDVRLPGTAPHVLEVQR